MIEKKQNIFTMHVLIKECKDSKSDGTMKQKKTKKTNQSASTIKKSFSKTKETQTGTFIS